MEAWWDEKDDESHHLERKVLTNGSELERENEIIFTAEENETILAAERAIAERDRIKQEKDKKNKTFLVLAMLFYSLGYVVPLEVGGIFSEAGRGFCMMYMVAGTVCLYIQYLVSIGKVSFGESTSEIGHSGWDGSDWD